MEKPKFAKFTHEGETYVVSLNPQGGIHFLLGKLKDFDEIVEDLDRGEQPKCTIPPSRRSKREIYRTIK